GERLGFHLVHFPDSHEAYPEFLLAGGGEASAVRAERHAGDRSNKVLRVEGFLSFVEECGNRENWALSQRRTHEPDGARTQCRKRLVSQLVHIPHSHETANFPHGETPTYPTKREIERSAASSKE